MLATKMRNQHLKKTLPRQLKENTYNISNGIGFICKILLYNRIKNTVSEEKCSWDKIHNKKLDKLHFQRRYISKQKYCLLKNIINNLPSYINIRKKVCVIVYFRATHTYKEHRQIMSILDTTSQFRKLGTDRNKTLGIKAQRTLRNIEKEAWRKWR